MQMVTFVVTATTFDVAFEKALRQALESQTLVDESRFRMSFVGMEAEIDRRYGHEPRVDQKFTFLVMTG